MIRFSHSANSWQAIVGSDGWFNISPDMARDMVDEGFVIYHEAKMIIEVVR